MSTEPVKFEGSIPENYEKYLVPLIFNPYAKDLALRVNVPSGGHVLEIAAGTGALSRVLRDWLTEEIKLTITDLNEPMLDICKPKFAPHENVEFQLADGMELPFGDNTFDAVVCQFGVMFFSDRVQGYGEMARVLKPGGRFYFNVWDAMEKNEMSTAIKKTLSKRFPESPSEFIETPFAHFNVEDHRAALDAAGFGDTKISVLTKSSVGPSARHVAEGFLLGSPLSQEILEVNGVDPADVIEDVERDIAEAFGNGPAIAKMRAIVFEAQVDG